VINWIERVMEAETILTSKGFRSTDSIDVDLTGKILM
jgi:hypothetical protein